MCATISTSDPWVFNVKSSCQIPQPSPWSWLHWTPAHFSHTTSQNGLPPPGIQAPLPQSYTSEWQKNLCRWLDLILKLELYNVKLKEARSQLSLAHSPEESQTLVFFQIVWLSCCQIEAHLHLPIFFRQPVLKAMEKSKNISYIFSQWSLLCPSVSKPSAECRWKHHSQQHRSWQTNCMGCSVELTKDQRCYNSSPSVVFILCDVRVYGGFIGDQGGEIV